MKVVNRKEELKVGDKLLFTNTIINLDYTKFCVDNNISYVVVTSLPNDSSYILVNFVNYKGRVIMRDYNVRPFHLRQSRFYYYEGS